MAMKKNGFTPFRNSKKQNISEKSISEKSRRVKFLTGFTLIEMMVAVLVFSVIVGASSQIFVSGFRSQRRALAQQEISDQTSYLMEYISRALRMARKDTDASCLGANLNYQKTLVGSGIRFENYQGVCQEFYLDGSQLKENKGGTILPLTSGNLEVSAFNIGPDDSWDQDDQEQPRITLFLEIQGKERRKIKIQTTITQRNLDIER